MTQELIIEQQGHLGIIRLNRVASLNALSIDMIHGIRQQVLTWQAFPQVHAILITSNSPKAFCAGGDVRYIYDGYYAQDNQHLNYFADEYAMLDTLSASKKPIIALLDGYVLGGGFGLAQACHLKVTSEKSRFAMPETVIGYFPDVAATHFLAQLKEIGLYLALTGEQISAADALAFQLVDAMVQQQDLAQLEHALIAAQMLDIASIKRLISEHSIKLETYPLKSHVACIEQCFKQASVENIESALQHVQDEEQAWAHSILAILQQRSPMAKRASFVLHHLGRNLSRQQAMLLERQVQALWFEQGDFIEGVRALIIDKDKQPKWHADQPDLDAKINALYQQQLALSA